MRWILGPELGRGISRIVYSWPLDAKVVIKVEPHGDGRFQNATEWNTWQWHKDDELGRWLAPCIAISECSRFLMQVRVDPLPYEKRPKTVPEVLVCDSHSGNIGLYKGRAVFSDYGCVETLPFKRTGGLRLKRAMFTAYNENPYTSGP